MKTNIKIISLLLGASLLSACSSTNSIKIVNGEDTLISTTKEGVTKTTLQTFYDDLYETNGTTVANNELVYQLGLKVFAASGRSQAEWDERIKEAFKDSFSSSYMMNSKFYESIYAASLRAKGYTITCPSSTFVGTREDLVEFNSLYSSLKCDYTDYIERDIARTVARNFLNEEYILDQKAVYFTNKLIREVQYFVFDPITYVDSDKYTVLFENAVKAIGDGDFKSLVLDAGGLQDQWKANKLIEAEKDFAFIDYTKSTNYSELYKDIFDMSGHNATTIASINSEIAEYSDSGTQSIFKGYELKQTNLKNLIYYYTAVGTNEGATMISSDLDAMIFKVADKLLLDANNYLRSQSGSDSIFIKGSDSKYYIIKVNIINDKSSLEDKQKGARALAKNSANTKNAIQYYLKKYNVTVHEDSLWDYIDDNYDYDAAGQ